MRPSRPDSSSDDSQGSAGQAGNLSGFEGPRLADIAAFVRRTADLPKSAGPTGEDIRRFVQRAGAPAIAPSEIAAQEARQLQERGREIAAADAREIESVRQTVLGGTVMEAPPLSLRQIQGLRSNRTEYATHLRNAEGRVEAVRARLEAQGSDPVLRAQLEAALAEAEEAVQANARELAETNAKLAPYEAGA